MYPRLRGSMLPWFSGRGAKKVFRVHLKDETIVGCPKVRLRQPHSEVFVVVHIDKLHRVKKMVLRS